MGPVSYSISKATPSSLPRLLEAPQATMVRCMWNCFLFCPASCKSHSIFFGVHYDLTLPDVPAVTISGADFQLVAAGVNQEDRFGIGPGVPLDIVPEGSATLFLFSIGLIVVVLARVYLAKTA